MTSPTPDEAEQSPLGCVNAPLELQPPGWCLRTLTEQDGPLLRAASEPDRVHLARTLPWPTRAADDDGAAAWLAEHTRGIGGRIGALGVFDPDGALCGGVNLLRYDPAHASLEMGVWLVRAAEGRGVMTAACRRAIAEARIRLGIERLVWRCEPDNLRSRAVADRLGFKYEGRLRSVQARPDGTRYDLDVLSLVGRELDLDLHADAR